MSNLTELFLERVATGLKRNSITTASKWAEQYRVMGGTRPGPWRFTYFPWLRAMHDSEAEINVGRKSAQVGYTEAVLNITFFTIDVLGYDCLYVLPNRTPDASDFSASRFDPALELSPHLQNLFSNVKNVGHKRAGSANLFVRGSQSRAGLKSVPVSLIVLDELEEFNEAAIPLALERTSGQAEKKVWMISTPGVDEDSGISAQYKNSTDEHFFFPCPSCNKLIEFKWPDSVEICGDNELDTRIKDSYYKCYLCNAKIEKTEEWYRHTLSQGIWVPSHADRDRRGFHINQLYSSTISVSSLISQYFKAQRDHYEEQEFFNSKLGLPHAVSGARLTLADLLLDNYSSGPRPGLITMGVDVGSFLHYEIDRWTITDPKTRDIHQEAKCQVLGIGKVEHFEQLVQVLQRFKPTFTIIDANPERRKALEFAHKFPGHVKLCFYGNNVNGKTINSTEETVTVDRTSWLDQSLGRFRNQTIRLPLDTPLEYLENLQAPIRKYEKDKNGNPVGRYVNSKPDHYAHARNYSEIALAFAARFGRNVSINIPM